MVEKWITRHWIALCVGCILTGIAVRAAYASRGYMAVGGEWAIIPAMLLAEWIIRTFRNED